MKTYYLGLLSGLLLVLTNLSCSEDGNQSPDLAGGIDPDATIYDGPRITFTKADGADFTQPIHQDRITDNVWITRGNQMGLYNIRLENEVSEFTSPEDTEWAEGTLDELESLSFTNFKTAAGGQGLTRSLPGKSFVVHLISEDIYLELMFLSWSRGGQGGEGGFSYERTTPGP